MASLRRIMQSGAAPLLATNIVGDTSATLTATGSVQGDALALSAINNYFGTVAANTGAQLPALGIGDSVFVYNGGASTLSVYGQTGEAIGSGAVNAAFSVATNKGANFRKITSTLWAPILSA